MKKKLVIGEMILKDIENKHHIKIIKEADKYCREFSIGDFVINGHGEAGFINPDYDLSSDVRVNVGGSIQISATGDDGYDTLEINNFHVFEVKKH